VISNRSVDAAAGTNSAMSVEWNGSSAHVSSTTKRCCSDELTTSPVATYSQVLEHLKSPRSDGSSITSVNATTAIIEVNGVALPVGVNAKSVMPIITNSFFNAPTACSGLAKNVDSIACEENGMLTLACIRHIERLVTLKVCARVARWLRSKKSKAFKFLKLHWKKDKSY